jgi:hypothetical protein
MSERAVLIVYRRPGCQVCDDAEALLAEELDVRRAAGGPVPTVERVSVDTSADLERRYGARVPVFALGARELDLVITPARLRALLDAHLEHANASAVPWS